MHPAHGLPRRHTITTSTAAPRSTTVPSSMGTTGRPGRGGFVNSEVIDSRLTQPLIDWLVQKESGPKSPEASWVEDLPATRLGIRISPAAAAAVAADRRTERRPWAAMAASAAAG